MNVRPSNVAGGIGFSQYGAPLFGGGLKMPMNEKLDLRTDARWFKSFGLQGSEQFRMAQGISFDVGKR